MLAAGCYGRPYAAIESARWTGTAVEVKTTDQQVLFVDPKGDGNLRMRRFSTTRTIIASVGLTAAGLAVGYILVLVSCCH